MTMTGPGSVVESGLDNVIEGFTEGPGWGRGTSGGSLGKSLVPSTHRRRGLEVIGGWRGSSFRLEEYYWKFGEALNRWEVE